MNSFGKKLTEELLENLHYKINPITKQENNPGHSSFIESCAHHCTSCSVEDDTWSGSKVSGSYQLDLSFQKSTPSLAFKYWFKSSTEFGSHFAFNSSLAALTNVSFSNTLPKFNSKTFLAMQYAAYPCASCCKCTVKQMPYDIVVPGKGSIKGLRSHA